MLLFKLINFNFNADMEIKNCSTLIVAMKRLEKKSLVLYGTIEFPEGPESRSVSGPHTV